MYKIVRHRFQGPNRTIKTRLTLDQAQAHCRSNLTHGLSNPHRPGCGKCPEHGVVRPNERDRCRVCDSHLHHDWFDGYTET